MRPLSAVVYYLLLSLAAAACRIALGVTVAAVRTVLALVVVILVVALQQSAANLAAAWVQSGRSCYSTVLQLTDSRVLSLPNSNVEESGIVDYSHEGRVRADFSLTIWYAENVDQARQLITRIASRDPRVLTDPLFEVVVDELGDNGVRLLVFPYVTPDNFWSVRNHMREQIKVQFDAAGIHFAWPETP